MRILRTLAILAIGVAFAFSAEGCHPFIPPNIVVIVVDDLGHADISAQGLPPGQEIRTPNIDSIAACGVRFTNGYVTAPVCSPSRAGLLTGRYQQRFGHELNPAVPADQPGFVLDLNEITLADRLRREGYATGYIGKWHLWHGAPIPPDLLVDFRGHPLNRGFDEFFGHKLGNHDYFLSNTPAGGNPILEGFESVYGEGQVPMEYLTYQFRDRAVRFIEEHARERFFLYFSPNAPHAPLQVPQEYLDLYPDLTGNRRIYAAMLRAADDAVGAMLAKLREHGLLRNTLIFFLSDNGGPLTQLAPNASNNSPLRGQKGDLWEGGMRVPFFMRWDLHLPRGVTYEPPVSSLDIFTTAIRAAGGEPPGDRPIDGVNLLPYLTGVNRNRPHETLFWRFGAPFAVRHGDWKLVKPTATASVQLYNLALDPEESTNRIDTEPGIAADLMTRFQTWSDNETIPPAW